jgi:DNA-binding transcriptional LysR family regulator
MVNVQRLWLLQQLSVLHTISAVASEEGLTRPGVSQHLSLLEREAGIPLLERVGRNVRLTGSARALLDHSQALFDAMESVDSHLDEQRHGVAGEIRLGAFSSVLATLVPPAIRALNLSHPGVRVQILELQPSEAMLGLANRRVDIAVVHDLFLDETPRDLFDHLPFLSDQFYAVMPAGHYLAERESVSLSDLANEPWVVNFAAQSNRAFVMTACRAEGFEPRLVAECTEASTVLSLIGAGLAVTILPGLALEGKPPGVVARPLTAPLVRRIHLAYRRGRGVHPVTKATIEALQASGRDFGRKEIPAP